MKQTPYKAAKNVFFEVSMEKIMFASDLHGSGDFTSSLVTYFNYEGADRLVLLGDILYHGPRNPLPQGYAPKEVISFLTPIADRILAVRGNCDTEVDELVLPFPLVDYAVIALDDRMIHLSHGHKYGEDNPPPMKKGDILIGGHTHVAKKAVKDGFVYLNPGSVSLPKERTPQGYILFDGKTFEFKHFGGVTYDSYTIE